MTGPRPTRAAVVGCGDVSVVHLEALAKLGGTELVGVCDTDPGRAAVAAARWGVAAFGDHRELLSAVRPQVVHVCTPHHQHVDVAADCLEAGVAVLLEKPVAHTVAEAERLIGVSRRHPGTKIGVCLQNRYNVAVRAAHDRLASGELGAVLGGSATVFWHRDAGYYRSRPWRGRRAESGGGVLINQAIHTIDLMEWLIGEVVAVRGHAGRYGPADPVDGNDTQRPAGSHGEFQRDGAGAGDEVGRGAVAAGGELAGGDVDVEDTAHLLLDHASGARSVLFATVTNAVDSPVTMEIATSAATLRIRGDLTVEHADGRVETVAERQAESGGRGYWGVSHELLIADFYRQLPAAEPFWISPAEATRSLRHLSALA